MKLRKSDAKDARSLKAKIEGRSEILESCFESHLHKYNWIRQHFAFERMRKHGASLFYQPERLRDVCRKYPVDVLMDAITETLKERRANYFNAFMEILGEEVTLGGWHNKSIE